MTSQLSQLSEAVGRLEMLSNQIDLIAGDPNAPAMREFVGYRREMGDLFYQLGGHATDCLAALPSELKAVGSSQFRTEQAALRTALADLQANWPLPAIAGNPKGYRAAKQQFNVAQTRYLQHIRGVLLPLLERGATS
jgi:hypothetical protein